MAVVAEDSGDSGDGGDRGSVERRGVLIWTLPIAKFDIVELIVPFLFAAAATSLHLVLFVDELLALLASAGRWGRHRGVVRRGRWRQWHVVGMLKV